VSRRREHYRLEGGRICIRLGAAEREPLAQYAHDLSIPLSEAARQLIRRGLKEPSTDDRADEQQAHTELLEELGLVNLVVGEQTLKLVETITPRGPGAADDLLEDATKAAQHRVAQGAGLVLPKWDRT
jgi:hypothetical protein